MSYPVNLALKGRRAVVIGAGAVAGRKVSDLLRADAAVRVVAAEVSEEIRSLARAGRIELVERDYRDGDLDGSFLAVAATDNEEVNARVSRDAQAAGILVNVVDRPGLCTFTLPAVVRRGALTLAVATDGKCPAFASVLREELESRYGGEYAEALELLAGLRKAMIAQGWNPARIREAIAGVYRAGLMDLIRAGRSGEVEQLVRERLGAEFAALLLDQPDRIS